MSALVYLLICSVFLEGGKYHICLWESYYYHKVREYFVYWDGHGLGSMAIHLAHHSLFIIRRIFNLLVIVGPTIQ